MTNDKRAQIDSVLKLMEQMVSRDGGTLSIKSYDATADRLVVDYYKGPKGGCELCILDDESLKDFIVEALSTRGVRVGDIVLKS